MANLMSKSELIKKIAEQHPNNMTPKDVKGVIESLAEIGYKELKKTGAFLALPVTRKAPGHDVASAHERHRRHSTSPYRARRRHPVRRSTPFLSPR